MKTIRLSTFLAAALAGVSTFAAAPAADETSSIRLNTIGYLPDREKKASIAAPCTEFAVVRVADGTKALEGMVSGPVGDRDTEAQVYVADFSTLRETGEYKLEVPGVGTSARFRVAADIYREPFYTVVRGMHLWRCGTAVKGTHAGQTFSHEACHTADAWLDFAGGGHVQIDGTGGWHDAGDYNKYVVNAGVTVGAMLKAWENHGDSIRKIRLDIPESDRETPDYLSEIRWEIEWLLKMQAKDGSVHHKLSTKNFGGFVLPELETTERYFTPWGSAATADLAAMMAMAARSFRPFDAAFADRCLEAARKSYDFLKAHPEDHRPDLGSFRTGAYQTRDPDERLWAAAELWETTGAKDALRDLEDRARVAQGKVDIDFDWGEVKNLGLLTYLFSRRPGRDEKLVSQVRESLLSAADSIVKTRSAHAYGRPLGARYYWGCNGSVARQTLVL